MQKNPVADQLAQVMRMAIGRIEVANAEGNPIMSALLPDMREALAKYDALRAEASPRGASYAVIRRQLKCGLALELDAEGAGRYTAFLVRDWNTPNRQRLRIGTVLGGNGNWIAEPQGGAAPFKGRTCPEAGRRLGDWAAEQPDGIAFANARTAPAAH